MKAEKFEDKMDERKECRIRTECWREKKTRRGKRERHTTRRADMLVNVGLSERDKNTEKKERRERIKESRYNRKYERCMPPRERECKRKKDDGEI
jgi:hypothetical protein